MTDVVMSDAPGGSRPTEGAAKEGKKKFEVKKVRRTRCRCRNVC